MIMGVRQFRFFDPTGVVQGTPSVGGGSDNAAYIAVRDSYNSNWMARVVGIVWTGWFNGGAVTRFDPGLRRSGKPRRNSGLE